MASLLGATLKAFRLVWICLAITLPSAYGFEKRSYEYKPEDIITRDVCIIGGGSTGTYSAIRLRDMGKSVVVVEKKDVLGGHTNTYVDPATHIPIDYGVIDFHNLSIVTDYFTRLNVPWTTAMFPSTQELYVNFNTGKVVDGFAPAGQAAFAQALDVWISHLEKYPYLSNGFFLPDPVPADLLLPFHDFVKKYSIDALVYSMFEYRQINILVQPTLYVMMNFNLDLIQNILNGFLTTASHDNSDIYRNALAILEKDVLLSSHVIWTDRDSSSEYVKVGVETPSGRKLIQAKKLVITIPPKLSNFKGFDLSQNESSLFGQFSNVAYYTTIVKHDGIPENLSVVNIGPNTPWNLPTLPAILSIYPSGDPGLHEVKFSSPYELSDDAVKAAIVAEFNQLHTGGAVASATTPEFVAFDSHTPFEFSVPADAIKDGFYKKLYALQGQQRTWYTGAAWDVHDSSLLWQFTETLLPAIAA
ncbi:putative FAD dependent oxidoreductase [Cenococcum geophilum 1.58]|uniref:putative FAD dependent oxidoreductase n=1 Tax=Cenococcum geophilum 1.58 TaxID=794803 RepID=UPI00358E011E|nr:putative FAD dependent oxidoreductase [Cenococcum geophilum 1.58]